MNNDDFILKSYNRTFQRRILHISLLKCVNSSEPGSPICKSDGEIDRMLNFSFALILTKNNYFDFDDFASPVNQLFEREDIQLRSEVYQFVNFKVQRNDYKLRDSHFQFSEEENTFYSYGDK